MKNKFYVKVAEKLMTVDPEVEPVSLRDLFIIGGALKSYEFLDN